MASHVSDTASQNARVSFRVVQGGSVGVAPVTFAHTPRYFFLPCEHLIKMYNTTTGALVRVLRGHTGLVTALATHPRLEQQLYSVSFDGTIRVWNYETASLLATHEVGKPLRALVFHPYSNDLFFATRGATKNNKSKKSKVYTMSTSTNEITFLTTSDSCKQLLVSPSGDHLVARFTSSFLVYHIATKTSRIIKHSRGLSAIAIHPREFFVAVGDEAGQMKFYDCLSSESSSKLVPHPRVQQKKFVMALEQWHSRPVTGIAFDADGSYLISAGSEATLVFWQLETGKKDFLPRIGSDGIVNMAFSENNEYYAVTSSDNSTRIVSAREKKVISFVPGLSHSGRQFATGIIPWPRLASSIIVGGSTGNVQFYDVQHDLVLMELQVTPKIKETSRYRGKWKEDTHRPLVTDVKTLNGAQWLATVAQQKRGPVQTPTSSLSFWQWADEKGIYFMNTLADNPHNATITSLAVHPTKPLALSTAANGQFRLWGLNWDTAASAPTGNGATGSVPPSSSPSWTCLNAGLYRSGDVRAGASHWSWDGSLVAITYHNLITLWDYRNDTLALRSTLSYAPTNETLIGVNFLKSPSGTLVAWSRSRIYVWDLVQSAVLWSLKLPIKDVAIDGRTGRILVHSRVKEANPEESTSNGYLFLFNPLVAEPIGVIDVGTERVKGIAFVEETAPEGTSAEGQSDIVYIGMHNVVNVFTTNQKRCAEFDAEVNGETLSISPSVFQNLFGDNSDLASPAVLISDKSEENSDEMDVEDVPSGEEVTDSALDEVFSGPAHTLPGPSILAGPFYERLLDKIAHQTEQSTQVPVEETGLEHNTIQKETYVASTPMQIIKNFTELNFMKLNAAEEIDNLQSFLAGLNFNDVSLKSDDIQVPKKRKRLSANSDTAAPPAAAPEAPAEEEQHQDKRPRRKSSTPKKPEPAPEERLPQSGRKTKRSSLESKGTRH